MIASKWALRYLQKSAKSKTFFLNLRKV